MTCEDATAEEKKNPEIAKRLDVELTSDQEVRAKVLHEELAAPNTPAFQAFRYAARLIIYLQDELDHANDVIAHQSVQLWKGATMTDQLQPMTHPPGSCLIGGDCDHVDRAAADLAELRPCYSIEGLTAFIAKHFPAMELRERASGSPSKERATPRTDKAKFTTHSTRHERYIEAVVVEFARELERELAEARNLIESEWFQRVTYKQQARKAREENERLRATLTGISTCSTCEACRGAAKRALGEQS